MIAYAGTLKIETDRLILRKLEHEDAQNIFDNWLSDERVSDNRVSAAHKSITETAERVDKIISSYDKKDFCYWGIELKTTGELIGEIDLYDFDTTTGNCAVSYSLGYRWWNNGYGTEALRAIVDIGFSHMNVHKISAAHNKHNSASGRLMSKVGMVQEGIIRDMIRNSKNQYKVCDIWVILREDYLKNIDKLKLTRNRH